MKIHLFPFHDDESATILETPAASIDVDEVPTSLTHQMVVDVYLSLIAASLKVGEFSQQLIDKAPAMTIDEMLTSIEDDLGYQVNKCAIVADDSSILNTINVVGEQLGKTMVDDSSSYEAAEVFNRYLKQVALSVIDFPGEQQ